MKKTLVQKLLPYMIVILGVIYGIWPVDVIPDVPVVGWIDDLGIIGTAIYLAFILYFRNKKTQEKNS